MSDATANSRAEGHKTPAWVKVSLIVVAILAIAFGVSLLAGVRHGPGLHGGDRTPTHQTSP
jgi:hypothetical protein